MSASARMQERMERIEAAKREAAEQARKRQEAATLEAKKKKLAKSVQDYQLPRLLSLAHFSSSLDKVAIAFCEHYPMMSRKTVKKTIKENARRMQFPGVGMRWHVNNQVLAKFSLTAADVTAIGSSIGCGARSAYLYFAKAKSAQIREEQPKLSLQEASKAMRAEWADMNDEDKASYVRMAEEVAQARVIMADKYKKISEFAQLVGSKRKAGSPLGHSQKRTKFELPAGWKAITTVRRKGPNAGKKGDTIYLAPDGRTRLRSLVAVQRYLNSSGSGSSSSSASESSSESSSDSDCQSEPGSVTGSGLFSASESDAEPSEL